MSEVDELTRQLATEQERADYAWRNTRTIEAARAEEMRRRDAAEAENARLRHHLTELAKFADRAAMVLATLEAENSDEEEQIQQIIDGISKWAAPAMLGTVTHND